KGDIVLVNWAFIHITLDGILFALAQCLRIAVAITGCLYFVMVTEIIDLSSVLGRFLQRLHISYTVPFMLTTSFKFLPEFMSSYSTIKESFLTRGFQLDKGNFAQKLKNFIPLFIPLIDTSLGKAQSIASAMLQRAFGAKKKRTFYTVYGFGLADVLFLALSLGMLGFSIYGQIVKLGGFDLHI
ncbi:MAG: energy-coupling factor transporter transmembrane component T, partial [Bacillota bacterium]